MSRPGSVGVLIIAVFLKPTGLLGQDYRLRLDTRMQSVSYRGFQIDSIPLADAVVDSRGSFATADGFAVRCGSSVCTFFRPGPVRRGTPLVTTADLSTWGFGVAGLSVRGRARFGTDLGGSDVWPGTQSNLQLVEGYARYARREIKIQLGRTHVMNRFGFQGFDGIRVAVRPNRLLTAGIYGGWGLARGTVLPVTSNALNPLSDFQPARRQILAGGDLRLVLRSLRALVAYQREVDPRADDFVSERAAISANFEPNPYLRVDGGADYDIAAGWWGSAEGRLTLTGPMNRIAGTFEVRRYRPHFELWSVWGAFSPVPYRAFSASLTVVPVDGLQLRARGEAYEFNDTETATPLVSVEDDGWRWSVAGSYAPSPLWAFSAQLHREAGTGAASVGFEASSVIRPTEHVSVTVRGGWLQRPLEFRFDDSRLWRLGWLGDFRPWDRAAFRAGATFYGERRRRPDAAEIEWDHVRIEVGATLYFGSDGSRRRLHPAILRLPQATRPR